MPVHKQLSAVPSANQTRLGISGHSGCGEKPLGSEAAPQGEPCRAVSSTVPGRRHRRSGELLVKVADLEGTA
jgi:hypothetical protein